MSFNDDCWSTQPRKTVKTHSAAATAVNINTTEKSDIAIQRDYFLDRLIQANCEKQSELTKLYALFIDNAPKSARDLIAAIEGKKYKLDEKKLNRLDEQVLDGEARYEYFNNTYGIIWDGPQADRKGYNLAVLELSQQYNTAKDLIMSADVASDMRKAIDVVIDWLPKQKKN